VHFAGPEKLSAGFDRLSVNLGFRKTVAAFKEPSTGFLKGSATRLAPAKAWSIRFFQRLVLISIFGLAIWVQAATATSQSESPVEQTASDEASYHGAIGVGAWNTAVEYKDLMVTSNGVVLYQSDFANQGTNGWRLAGGIWDTAQGVLRESAREPNCRAAFGDTNWANYTLTLRARKTGGREGFLIGFNLLDDQNWTWFDVGGRANTQSYIEQMVNGASTSGARVPQTILTNVWYDIRVVLSGPRIECYVNSNLIQDFTCASSINARTTTGLSPAGPIQSVRRILELHGPEAFKGLEAQIEGVVVYADPVKNEVLFKDSSGAMRVPIDLGSNPILPGTYAVLQGKTTAEVISYPDHPSGRQYLTSFEAPINLGELYVARVRGFIHPPRTGNYTFWIASDNGSELWLSTDDDPVHGRKIASVNNIMNYSSYRGWDQMPSQRSVGIFLEAGKKYYIEATHWNPVGEDSLSVAWAGPELPRAVIDGEFLSPVASDADGSPTQRGRILREFWLKYPFATHSEMSAWHNDTNTVASRVSMEAFIKTFTPRYGKPLITQAKLTPLTGRSLPDPVAIQLEQSWTNKDDFRWARAEGVIDQITTDGVYWTMLEIVDNGHQMTVRVANPQQANLHSWLNTRVLVHGFCEGYLTMGGDRHASVLWVPSIGNIVPRPPADDDWAQMPAISVRDLESVNVSSHAGQRVRLTARFVAGQPGQPLVVRDAISRFSAFVSTNGTDWNQVGDPVEIPMNQTVHAGIIAYRATGHFDHLSGRLFPGTDGEIGNPPTPGNSQGDAMNLAVTGWGNIGGRAGVDATNADDFHYFYSRMEGDGEMVAHLKSLVATTNGLEGIGTGLMVRETLERNSRFSFLSVGPGGDLDFRVRRGKSNAIESFPHGGKPPVWLKLTRQSAPPIKVYGAGTTVFEPDQAIEVTGVLERTNDGWVLNQAFCRAAEAETPGTNSASEAHPQREINSVRRIRQLGVDRLKQMPPARIRGVVTVKAGDLYVQDDTGGIRIPSSAAQQFADCHPGQQVVISGRCAFSGTSPVIEPGPQSDSVTVLGMGVMPKPFPRNWSQLMTGQQDAQWVEVKGVVHKLDGRTLKLQMPGGDLLADLGFAIKAEQARALADCTVRIRGVCQVTANGKEQQAGVRLIVPAAEYIIVDEASPADPFGVPPQPISQILQPSDQYELIHRVKIGGVVTCVRRGACFVEDATGGIEVRNDGLFQEGNQVEVLGFASSDGFAGTLNDALVRKTGTDEMPRPTQLQSGSLPQTVNASRLISMTAVFLGHSELLDNEVLQLQTGGRVFQAILPKDRGALPDLEPESVLRVTGVCRIVKDHAGNYSSSNPDFELLLSSVAGVHVLQSPSWWNWRRFLWVGGTFLVVLGVAVTWVAMILRQNRLLEHAQLELQKANEELEVRVQRRTADLARANAELTREQALLRTLLDNASDYIYFKDAGSRFIRCSLSLCVRSALSHEQIVGKTNFEIYHGEYARSAFEDEQEIIRTGKPLIGKLEKEVHADGRVTWVTTNKMPWRNAEGKIIGTFGISMDITSIKEAEAKLEKVHRQLVDASRKAGQAEVASSVLHNVGNVLNSITVSAGVIMERVRASKVSAGMTKLVALLDEHQHELIKFLSEDGRTDTIPAYLKAIAQQMQAEQATMLDEVYSLSRNINHIKEVVAMQQNYGHVSGVLEKQSIPALVEDALRMHITSLERHDTRVVRRFEPAPDIMVDKHKVLQILVNLISNAKQAVCESAEEEKVITVGISLSGDKKVCVSVADNGVGISPENLQRIFRQGFTTRKDGHGYGLHSSILAARESGGNLLVQSDGPGKGSVFTLELPCLSEGETPASIP
jgi:PAS domain S-box-containing protein